MWTRTTRSLDWESDGGLPTYPAIRMTDSVDPLEQALSEVPEVLLDRDERAVLGDARVSASILKAIEDDPKIVVFVGPSGAGRSFVFNRTIGLELSDEGVLRPTTTMIIGANAGSHTGVDAWGEITIVPDAPVGMTLFDTPSWEHDRHVVADVLSKADLAVLVVSPRRYADASVSELWAEMQAVPREIVLNRAPKDMDDRDQLVESIISIFGAVPVIVDEDVSDLSDLRTVLGERLENQRVVARRNIMRRCVSSAARFIARAVTNNAWQIAAVRSELQDAPMPEDARESLSVHDSWLATKQAMVESVARRIRDRDDDVVRGSGTPLAPRILGGLGPWDESTLDADLDAWRERCIDLHEEAASMRWRRASRRQLIERLSWKSAINDDVVQSKRFLRIMGKEFPAVADAVREELHILLEGSIEERRVRWLDVLADLGEYQPGSLIALAESLEDEERTDG